MSNLQKTAVINAVKTSTEHWTNDLTIERLHELMEGAYNSHVDKYLEDLEPIEANFVMEFEKRNSPTRKYNYPLIYILNDIYEKIESNEYEFSNNIQAKAVYDLLINELIEGDSITIGMLETICWAHITDIGRINKIEDLLHYVIVDRWHLKSKTWTDFINKTFTIINKQIKCTYLKHQKSLS